MRNSSKIWKIVKDIVRYKRKQINSLLKLIINADNSILKDPVIISISFNHYFANIGRSLPAKIPSTNTNTNSQIPQRSSSFF